MPAALQAHPELSRQIDHPDLLLFWRSREGVGREGLLCMVDFCRNPDCLCAEVSLECLPVSESLLGVELRKRKLRLSFAPDASPAAAGSVLLKVDFQEGTVRIDDDDEGHPPASLVLAWFEGEIETELLDSLHARWSRARGLDPRRRVQPEAPEPGERIFWSDVYPNAREDRYLIGASSFLIEELVCVEPNCECSEARLVVFDVSDGGYGNEVGSWLVREEAVVEWKPGTCLHETLAPLWEAYQRRHRALARLAAHRAEVRAAIAEMRQTKDAPVGPPRVRTGPPPALSRTPRNAKCPCGSGKKFKKCCGS